MATTFLGEARLWGSWGILGGAGESRVIKAGLTDGDDFFVRGEFVEFVGNFGGGGGDIRRMPSDGGEDIRELLRDFDCAAAAFQSGADGNDARDAGAFGTFDH